MSPRFSGKSPSPARPGCTREVGGRGIVWFLRGRYGAYTYPYPPRTRWNWGNREYFDGFREMVGKWEVSVRNGEEVVEGWLNEQFLRSQKNAEALNKIGKNRNMNRKVTVKTDLTMRTSPSTKLYTTVPAGRSITNQPAVLSHTEISRGGNVRLHSSLK